ncbi:hypothetical protein J1605_002271 [Eschrichtius robustus]|uniref:Uncharacterized protein n=1 Tax=Eschrichtius robustus TaxID=9764 RepID=A0AB34HTH9_ESCRO|nr:hypothetical protein J1605_002271 [Eschrichtius robustus]
MRGEDHGGPAGPCASPAPLRPHKGPRPAGRPRCPHLCPAADPPSEAAAPPGEALRHAAERRRASAGEVMPAPTPPPGSPGSAPGSEPRPAGRAPPPPQTSESPGCSLLRRPESRPFSAALAPSESSPGPARPRKSFAVSLVARASSRALSRCR